jgi:hypothetical protein
MDPKFELMLWMTKTGTSRKDLAKAIRVSEGAVMGWLTGTTPQPRAASEIEKITGVRFGRIRRPRRKGMHIVCSAQCSDTLVPCQACGSAEAAQDNGCGSASQADSGHEPEGTPETVQPSVTLPWDHLKALKVSALAALDALAVSDREGAFDAMAAWDAVRLRVERETEQAAPVAAE